MRLLLHKASSWQPVSCRGLVLYRRTVLPLNNGGGGGTYWYLLLLFKQDIIQITVNISIRFPFEQKYKRSKLFFF